MNKYGQEISWTLFNGVVMRVERGYFATAKEAWDAAEPIARHNGWTPPRWWQWWRWRDTRKPKSFDP